MDQTIPITNLNSEAKDNTEYNTDGRIEKINTMLARFAMSDYSVKEAVSGKGDELDTIIMRLNALGESLTAKIKVQQQYDARVNKIMEALLEYTLMDFSTRLEISDAGDEIDAISVGLNTMIEELQASKQMEKDTISKLEKKAEEVLNLNDALEANIYKLELVNKELEAFTYSVSHDLRTPLRAIHSYTRILSDEYLNNVNADGKHMMEAVMRNAKKMGQLIDDLLSFSKVGKKELQLSMIDMKKLAETTLEELRVANDIFKTKITLHDLPPAIGDYILVGQVFANLISNAVKYSSAKENPEVEIGFKIIDGEPVYYVKDNGAGFDMKYYNKLFGVFQRLHAANEFEGTGVGLALVKRIIQRHGGRVWAEGELDKGAVFYFTLKTDTIKN